MINIGDSVFNSIESSEYLHSLFNKLVENYTAHVFDKSHQSTLTNKEKKDALRFADILSKSTNDAKKDIHYNWAQNIVTMLNTIYCDDPIVKYYLGSVLTNVNNYYGLGNNCADYVNFDFVECAKEEIIKDGYSIPNNEGHYFINKQLVAFESLNRSDSYSFSAPTSLGKTFVIRMFIKNRILQGEKANYVIVVPTNALINEVYNSIINDLNDNLDKNSYKVVKSPASIIGEDDRYNYIMVYTQERLLYHLIKIKNQVINYLFIDEAHKISVNEGRSAFFYKIMSIINREQSGAKIYFSSPNIPNPQIYLELVNDGLNKSSSRIKYSPVNQNKLIIDKESKRILYYSEIETKFKEHSLPVQNFQWDGTICDYIHSIASGQSNIVFCNTKKEAVAGAKEYAESEDEIENDELSELINDVKEEIHDDCYLAVTLKRGVAYHVAYIPTRIKEKIEDLFKRKIIKTVFCTSTLLEGVNFPAENLFLMLKSDSRWLNTESRVDFKNLIGRVGRIEYNLFGNVFFICDNSTVRQYEDAVCLDVDDQRLSMEFFLSENRKKEIVATLLDGKTMLSKKTTYEEFNFARYALNTLLKDILHNNKSKVYHIFEKYLGREKEELIRNLFQANGFVQEDLSTTADQIESVDSSIKQNNQIYPKVINYNNTVTLLLNLHKMFNWSIYESKSELGNETRLRYYAVILQQWILGFGVKQIIEATISWHRESGTIFMDGKNCTYDDSIEQKNYLIDDVLNTLEKIIQFKIKNYFLKYSERAIENGQDLQSNDWYEFVEYGTNNYVAILLQKIGFSRESALYILRDHRDKLVINDGKIIKLNPKLIDYRKIKKEVLQVKYNNSSLFR